MVVSAGMAHILSLICSILAPGKQTTMSPSLFSLVSVFLTVESHVTPLISLDSINHCCWISLSYVLFVSHRSSSLFSLVLSVFCLFSCLHHIPFPGVPCIIDYDHQICPLLSSACHQLLSSCLCRSVYPVDSNIAPLPVDYPCNSRKYVCVAGFRVPEHISFPSIRFHLSPPHRRTGRGGRGAAAPPIRAVCRHEFGQRVDIIRAKHNTCLNNTNLGSVTAVNGKKNSFRVCYWS